LSIPVAGKTLVVAKVGLQVQSPDLEKRIEICRKGPAVAACRWCIADGQFDDVVTPALRMLRDD
jgi:hypothetical protein